MKPMLLMLTRINLKRILDEGCTVKLLPEKRRAIVTLDGRDYLVDSDDYDLLVRSLNKLELVMG